MWLGRWADRFAVIHRNMADACKGRTELITAHGIIVMNKGQIMEAGPHQVWVNQGQGLRAHLWRTRDRGCRL